MSGDSATRLGLRSLAIAIAIAAVVDPSITTRRASKPDVVVVVGDSSRDASLATRVEKVLSKQFSVVRTPLSGAVGTVIVGDRLPQRATEADGPTFAVTPSTAGGRATITSVTAPRVIAAASRVPVNVAVRAASARGKDVEIVLRSDSLAVDRVTRRIENDDEIINAALTFVPVAPGPVALRVTATIVGNGSSQISADLAVDVRDKRWTVLFYDPRPSWMSTFVRRAVERDPRFLVSSRVVTSRTVSTDVGNLPARLDDLAALSLFDAVVVGAPDALSAADVAGLEAFLRRRGGSVLLLLDDRVPGAYDRLMDAPAWSTAAGSQIVPITARAGDSLGLQATNLAWPTTLPAAADLIAGGSRPVVWREPVGAGRLIVSGALDAWRFRDRAASSFDRFWQTLVADAANASPPPLEGSLSDAIVAPGEWVDASMTVRDAAIGSTAGRASPRVMLVSAALDSARRPVRLWPGAIGRLDGRFRAPREPGLHHVSMVADGERIDLPLIVAATPHRASPGAEASLADEVRARGGALLSEAQLDRLPSLLANAVHPASRLVTWHPMRSAWWLIPFVLALSAEWWIRRRRGLP